MGEPKLLNRAMCERNTQLHKQNCGTHNLWMAQVHFKILHEIEIHTRQIDPLWVNTKTFLFHELLTVNSSCCKAECKNWERYLRCDDAKSSAILLTHSCFLCGHVANMAAKQVQRLNKGRKKHHLNSAPPHFTKIHSKWWILCSIQKQQQLERKLCIRTLLFLTTLCKKHLSE